VTPWSGHWWPFNQSGSLNLYDDNGPLEKYDRYVEADTGTNPGTKAWEADNHASGAGWWGHCHAWAAASVLEPEPRAVTKLGVKFTQDDMEGLLTELYYSPAYQRWGTECQDCPDGSGPFTDVHPSDFDWVMREYMGKQRKNVIMDLDPSTPVWNYPAYQYTRTATTIDGVEHVTMSVKIARPVVGISGTETDTVRFTYTLQPGTKGEWTGNSVYYHPDFVWIATSRVGQGSGHNPLLKYSVVQEIMQ